MDSIIAKRIETGLLGHEVAGWTILNRLDSGKSASYSRHPGIVNLPPSRFLIRRWLNDMARMYNLDGLNGS